MTIINDMNYKLNEAKHYLNEMRIKQSSGTKEEFTYAFSSFLSSVRSVTQYALEYNKQVYDSLISNLKYKGVFTDLRNENIHAKPVRISNAGQSSITVSITVTNGENEVDSLEEDEDKEAIDPFLKNEYYYIFEGQFDTPEYRDKTLIALASLYVDEVEKYISDFEQLI